MRGRPGTKIELESLDAAAKYFADKGLPLAKHLRSLYTKLALTKAKPESTLTPISHIQAALVENAKGKILPLETATQQDWIILQNRFGQYKATVEEARMVGAWLARQHWYTSSTTIDQVIKYWGSWLTRAKADPNGAAKETHDGWKRSEL